MRSMLENDRMGTVGSQWTKRATRRQGPRNSVVFASTLMLVVAVSIAAASSARGQVVLFSDDFDVNSTANWTVNSFIGGTTASGGSAANASDFFFDYSTDVIRKSAIGV